MKLRTLIIISILAVSALSCELVLTTAYEEQWGDRKVYNLRDRGPAGGRIFYINPNYDDDGWMYLEALPEEKDNVSRWWIPFGGVKEEIGTTSSIGDGLENTGLIMEWVESETANDAPAAEYCSNLKYGGYDDWFLPSHGEMMKMRKNLRSGTDDYGETFDPLPYYMGNHFSSSEYYSLNPASNIRFVSFNNDNSNLWASKENSYYSLCARRFQGEIY